MISFCKPSRCPIDFAFNLRNIGSTKQGLASFLCFKWLKGVEDFCFVV